MSDQRKRPDATGLSPDELRGEVAQTYRERISQRSSRGGRDRDAQEARAALADLADIVGYSGAELTSLPADAVADSFGCGNPMAVAGLHEGDVVLDLGSGAGIDLMLAGKAVGPSGRVIGIDMTDEMIARANDNIASGDFTNVEVRKGLIEQIPVEAESVDRVISNCVINLCTQARMSAPVCHE